jgi:RND family efflux transporter MFP subunit
MRTKSKVGLAVIAVALVGGGVGYMQWNGARTAAQTTTSAANGTQNGTPGKTAGGGAPVSVTTTLVKNQTLPVTAVANGTVVALQSVDIRAQVNATIKAIHFKEGVTVKKGDLLFSLDNRTEEAAQKRADAQVVKSQSDYTNAERTLKRQRELFEQKFISQAALDTATNQVDLLKGQLAVDQASAEVSRVARSLTEIRAPFTGRSGAISVRIGSLVQPTGAALVTISQIDPIAVSFGLPERERAAIQQSMDKGDVAVSVELEGEQSQKQKQALVGKLSFVESTIDSTSGTIPMKATFANPGYPLWPGMFVNVTIPTRSIADAAVVPVQAVQTGPERKFVYVISAENVATIRPVEVTLIQGGLAAITGVAPGTRIVVEGAQNVRPNGVVREGEKVSEKAGKAADGKRGGEKAKTEAKADVDAKSIEKSDATSPAAAPASPAPQK